MFNVQNSLGHAFPRSREAEKNEDSSTFNGRAGRRRNLTKI